MLIVQKFGGTSVGDTDRITNVAQKVAKEVHAGNQVMVVVSAMAGVTDRLVGYARTLSALDTPEAWADYDMVVASGEQITAGLLALKLRAMGIPARGWAGWQVPIISSEEHGKARINRIDKGAVSESLALGEVAVVAGFQGMTEKGRISTLGRGGSDTSAVALAAAFGAGRCDIYTDVDGVYTTDPRIVRNAKKLEKVAYEEMLEMASQGAKVLQTRSVEMAMNHNVVVQVLSSFADSPIGSIGGTLLVREEDIVEKERVTGIAYSRDEARITVSGVQDRPGVSAAIFVPLAKAGVNVDMIVQNVTPDGKDTDVTFTISRSDLDNAKKVIEHTASEGKIAYRALHTAADVAKVSVIGVGMRSHAGIAGEMFTTLAEKGINILLITTSEIKISVLIEEAYLELAIRALHTAYGLDAVVEKG